MKKMVLLSVVLWSGQALATGGALVECEAHDARHAYVARFGVSGAVRAPADLNLVVRDDTSESVVYLAGERGKLTYASPGANISAEIRLNGSLAAEWPAEAEFVVTSGDVQAVGMCRVVGPIR